MISKCSVADCGKKIRSGGLCGMHRQRLLRHGHLEQTRPHGWGHGFGHPLYNRWQSMRRGGRLQGGIHARWDVFWDFLEDVGTPPDLTYKLFRLDEALPYGPGNFEWRPRVATAKIVTGDQASRNAYARAYNAANPHILKNFYLRRHYGITLAQYEEMFAAQDGRCAICHCHETRVYKKTGELMLLAVDHCHISGRNRGLLCSHCNHGLGNFRDDPVLLRTAIAYLEAHAEPSPPSPADQIEVVKARE